MNERAHTPEEKRAIIERLYALWIQNPDLRLGQLILNCFSFDFYRVEDTPFIETIEQTYEHYH